MAGQWLPRLQVALSESQPSQAFSVSVRPRGPRQAAEMTCLGFVPHPHTLVQPLLGLPVPVVPSSSQKWWAGQGGPCHHSDTCAFPLLLLAVEITAAQLTVCPLGAGPGAVFAGGPVLLSFCYCPVRWAPSADRKLQLSRKTELPGASAGGGSAKVQAPSPEPAPGSHAAPLARARPTQGSWVLHAMCGSPSDTASAHSARPRGPGHGPASLQVDTVNDYGQSVTPGSSPSSPS